jgi:hypothetical protein
MATDPNKLLAFCRGLADFNDDELVAMDRAGLIAMQVELKALKREVDRALLRLSFIDARQVN